MNVDSKRIDGHRHLVILAPGAERLKQTEPEGMSIAKITAQPIPEDWNEQRRLYGFPER